MHVALTGIVTEDAIDHDFLLALTKPAVFPSELRFCLCWRWWEIKPRYNANNPGQGSLEREQPTTEIS
jgi:hypothetical protein